MRPGSARRLTERAHNSHSHHQMHARALEFSSSRAPFAAPGQPHAASRRGASLVRITGSHLIRAQLLRCGVCHRPTRISLHCEPCATNASTTPAPWPQLTTHVLQEPPCGRLACQVCALYGAESCRTLRELPRQRALGPLTEGERFHSPGEGGQSEACHRCWNWANRVSGATPRANQRDGGASDQRGRGCARQTRSQPLSAA